LNISQVLDYWIDQNGKPIETTYLRCQQCYLPVNLLDN
jgi:hypothetical protein